MVNTAQKNAAQLHNVLYINKEVRHYRIPVYTRLARLFAQNGQSFAVFTSQHLTGEFEKQLMQERLKVIYSKSTSTKSAPQKFGANPIRFQVNLHLLHHLMTVRPKVILQEGFAGWGVASWFAKAFYGARIVISYERTLFTERNNNWLRTLYHKLSVRYLADAIAVNGWQSFSYLISIGCDPSKVRIGSMSAWVPRTNRKILQSLLLSDKQLSQTMPKAAAIRVVVCGRFVEGKGILQLLQCLHHLDSISGIASILEFEMYGEGPLLPEIRDANFKNLAVHCWGQQPAFVLTKAYKSADVLLLLTLDDNWSLVVAEAMAAKCIPVTTIFNGVVPDLVDSTTGRIVNPFSPEEIAHCLITLAENPKQTEEMKIAANNRAKNFNALRAARTLYDSAEAATNINQEYSTLTP